jgi:hypothetical protein
MAKQSMKQTPVKVRLLPIFAPFLDGMPQFTLKFQNLKNRQKWRQNDNEQLNKL